MISGRTAGLALLAAAAVSLGGYWLVSNTEWVETTHPTPLKGEAARDPLYAAAQLASRLGARVTQPQSLARMPPDGAVLVLVSGHWDLFPERRAALRAWVERGGRLVMSMGRITRDDDLAQWLHVSSRYDTEAQEAESVCKKPQETADDEADNQPPALAVTPWGASRCDQLRESGLAAVPGLTEYRVCGFSRYSVLVLDGPALWQLDGPVGPQVARVAAGQGSVTLLQEDYILQRQALLKGDHARLFAAATGLRAGDELWLVAFERADSVFVLAWRHGAPVLLLLLLAIALALWRGLRRFGPAAAAPGTGRRSLAEQVRGTGAFLLRHGRGPVLRAAAVRALHDTASTRIAGWVRMPPAQRTAAMARLAGIPAAPLEKAMAVEADAPRHELEQALALIETTRRALARWRAPTAAAARADQP